MITHASARALNLHTRSANAHITARKLRRQPGALDELRLHCEFLEKDQLKVLAGSLRLLIVSSIQLTAPVSGKGWVVGICWFLGCLAL